MEVKINSVNNGFILSVDEKVEDGGIVKQMEVIQEKETDKETMKELLEWIAEYFGCEYDKWTEDNLSIEFNKKGSKVE